MSYRLVAVVFWTKERPLCTLLLCLSELQGLQTPIRLCVYFSKPSLMLHDALMQPERWVSEL